MSLLPSLTEAVSEIRADMKEMRAELRGEIKSVRSELSGVRADMLGLDGKLNDLRNEMLERFERTQETVNELGHRITRLDGRIEGYMEIMNILQAGGKRLKIAKGN